MIYNSPLVRLVNHCLTTRTARTTRTSRTTCNTPQVSPMICNSPLVRLVNHCFTTRTARTTRTGRPMPFTTRIRSCKKWTSRNKRKLSSALVNICVRVQIRWERRTLFKTAQKELKRKTHWLSLSVLSYWELSIPVKFIFPFMYYRSPKFMKSVWSSAMLTVPMNTSTQILSFLW